MNTRELETRGSKYDRLASQSLVTSLQQTIMEPAASELAAALESHGHRLRDVFPGTASSLVDLPSLAQTAIDSLGESQHLAHRKPSAWAHDSQSLQAFITLAHPLLLRASCQKAAGILATIQATQRINVLELQVQSQSELLQLQERRLEAQGRQIDALAGQVLIIHRTTLSPAHS